jgi:hypothetical protein
VNDCAQIVPVRIGNGWEAVSRGACAFVVRSVPAAAVIVDRGEHWTAVLMMAPVYLVEAVASLGRLNHA